MWTCKLISKNVERIILANKMQNLLNCFRRFKAVPLVFQEGPFELQSKITFVVEEKGWP
jgi:hypothetical protein